MSAIVGAQSPYSRNVKTTSRRVVSCSVRASASARAGYPSNGAATPAVDRRGLLASAAALTAMSQCKPSLAIQGYTAGRIPGVTPDPELEGFNVYTRPEGKQGGHGVGWSEIPRYSFRVPSGWQEEPVSIADLGGTEIDLRFAGDEGSLEVVVAPVLRFRDVGFNADVRIEELGPPENIIEGFAPELFGNPIGNFDEDVSSISVVKQQGLTFYKYEMAKPRSLVAATAFKNRVFILVVAANGRQWRKSQDKLRIVADSFKLPQTA